MRGIDVVLYERTENGVDQFGNVAYEEVPVTVANVLVGTPTDTEVLTAQSLYGSKAVYVLAIPKGDAHDWSAGSRVDFFGASWKTIGYPVQTIDELTPTPWNKKVKVETYG